LAWDANSDSDIDHYNVYIGTAPGSRNVGLQRVPATQPTTVFGATPGVLYYFAVSATNAEGFEGPLSGEISGSIPLLFQPADRTNTLGVPIVPLHLTVSDPDGSTLQFSHTGLPLGLVLDPTTGLITGIPTALGTYTVDIIVSDGTLRSQRSFVWTIMPPAVLTADGATPVSGAGSTQMFSLQYSSSLGATNVSTAWVWFSATLAASSSNSCMLYYNRGTSTLYLLNDGQTWMPGALGSGTVLQNSQCAVDLGASAAALSGTSLTVHLAMTFKAAYAGAKHIYMYAQNAAAENSGWQDRGDWTVPGVGSAVITADSATPASGSGDAQTFALQYSDNLGASDLSTAWVWFNATFAATSSNSCIAYYDRRVSRLFLLSDAQTWISGALGGAATLANSQCAVALSQSSVTLSGDTLILNIAMTFTGGFAGAKNIYTYAQNVNNANSGWQDRGDWTVPGVSGAMPTITTITADAVEPHGGSGAAQTFALRYSDTRGATDLSTVWAWFNASFSGSAANSCMAYYNRPTGTLHLLGDGNTWMSGVLGAAGQLQNSQCAVSLSESSVSLDGNTLTLNLAMAFETVYAGTKRIYVYGQNAQNVNSDWQDRGEWTVPGAESAVVSADAATPETGSGSSQTFSLQYAASLGATDLATTWVWFASAFTDSASNSCLVYYDRVANRLYLLGDNGSWMFGTLGNFGTLQNSQCSVGLRRSLVTLSGSTLTLSIPMTFTSGYAGDKRIYMFAQNANNVSSGWQDRGAWTVP
jgi:hypothetical protein